MASEVIADHPRRQSDSDDHRQPVKGKPSGPREQEHSSPRPDRHHPDAPPRTDREHIYDSHEPKSTPDLRPVPPPTEDSDQTTDTSRGAHFGLGSTAECDGDFPGSSPLATKEHRSQSDLIESKEFKDDLDKVAEYLDQEKDCGLEVGKRAAKWIGDRRYDRKLNPARFAIELKRRTKKDLTGKQIENYVKAYREHEFHLQSGKRFPNLSVSHLSQIANSRCRDDSERLELAERVNDQKTPVRQVRHLAARLHAERTRAERVVTLTPLKASVQVVDGHHFLREQADHSISCLLADWQWDSPTWGGYADFPKVHCPDDPVDHLCRCLRTAANKLSETGLVYIFHTSVGLLDRRIEDVWEDSGFQHAGTLIWQKACGEFIDSGSPLAVAHEPVHILCRKGTVPKSVCGYVGSVTPKWAAPTNAHSGKQHAAVHPHQKPVQLMELLISVATVNGLVVDPYAGSGSGGVAAIRRGCSYVGAELVPEYARIANERIAMACGEVEQVTEAINFFLHDADPAQAAAISNHVEKAGLLCAQREEGELI